ncbi:hypothetical protein B566_EDAN015265 [Ephemera danica]|nr:hypothetical protein B566_EDAN015265 [Ephemera danica]
MIGECWATGEGEGYVNRQKFLVMNDLDCVVILGNYYIVAAGVVPLLQDDIIEPSDSAWNPPVCLPMKADGTRRFAIDMRKVNKVTRTDSYTMPRVVDTLESLHLSLGSPL